MDYPPVTAEDREFWTERERQLLRDAVLSDSELHAYHIATARHLTEQRLRQPPSPVWIRVQTATRLAVIEAEVERRRKLADYGAPDYAPEDFYADALATLRARVDLAVILTEGGLIFHPTRNHHADAWAICPFHVENTASFQADFEKKVWHCFGCGQGGDVFTFMELRGGMSFWDAAKYLGKRFGVSFERPPTPQSWRTID